MPPADAQRTWFPEMIQTLRQRWRPDLSFDAIVELRDQLDAMLQKLRSKRHMRPAVTRCPACGKLGPAPDPHVSVRSLILALKRYEVVAADQAYPLEKAWAVHRKEHNLDLYGKPQQETPVGAAACSHRR